MVKKYTKEEWEKFFEMNKDFYTMAYCFVAEKTQNPRGYAINHIQVEGDKLEVEYDDTCFGCTSCDWETFPMAYLWDDNWQETMKEDVAKVKKLREQWAAEEQRKLDEAIERKEREQLEILKKKYG
jgi:hypothetical protein